MKIKKKLNNSLIYLVKKENKNVNSINFAAHPRERKHKLHVALFNKLE